MRRLFAVVALLIAVPACAQSNPLQQAVTEGVRSMAWTIETRGVSVCCCDGEQWTDTRSGTETREVVVVAQLGAKRVTRLRLREPSCPIDAERVVRASTAQSFDFLLAQLGGADEASRLIATIALHDDPRVVPRLIDLARHDASSDVRRQAIFWLGQRAGEKAAGELRRAVDEDPNDEVRKHAVFAISQLPKERSVPMLIELVKSHKSAAVRKRAMFWLAQTDDPRALDFIEQVLGTR